MLYQFNQQKPMGVVLAVLRNNNSIDLISLKGTKDAPVLRFVYGAPQWRKYQGNSQLLRPLSHPSTRGVFPRHLPPNKNDIDELGHSLGKQLKALSPDFKSSINADARDVASRPRNARYDSLTNRISGQGYNWNCARSCFEL